MRRLRVAIAIVSATGCLHALTACGDDDNAVAPPRDGGTDSAGDAFAPIDATPPDEDGGAFVVTDVADTPCTASPAAAAAKVLYPGSGDPIVSLSAMGTRRVAHRATGFVFLDADGNNASATGIASARAAVAIDATTVAAVSNGAVGPALSLYDATGAPKATGLPAYDSPVLGMTVGGGGGAGLMVWASPFGVFARGIAPTDFIGPTFPIAGSGDVQAFAVSVVRKGDGTFGVAFSGETPNTGEQRRLSFVRTTTTGRIATGFNLEIGTNRRRVVQLVPRDKGWALLVDYGTPSNAHLMLLDEEGRIEGPVLRLLGVTSGYGLATSGGELGVLALRTKATPDAGDGGADGGVVEAGTMPPPGVTVAFRPFDTKGAPLDDWRCFEESTGVEGAILGEDSGYAASYVRGNGDVAYVRFDRRGN